MIRLRRSRRNPIEMNITPLIDMVFLLLVFFMLTSHFLIPSGIPLRLPQAETAEPQDEQKIIVSIDREGALFINGETVEKTILRERLSAFLEEGEEQLVVVQSDSSVAMGTVVEVLDIIRFHGGENVLISTERVEHEEN